MKYILYGILVSVLLYFFAVVALYLGQEFFVFPANTETTKVPEYLPITEYKVMTEDGVEL